jgi:hypothetical protein
VNTAPGQWVTREVHETFFVQSLKLIETEECEDWLKKV